MQNQSYLSGISNDSTRSRVVIYSKESLQYLTCLLDEGIAKTCKKSNSHNGFLRAEKDRARNCCKMGWIDCAI